MTGDPQLAYPHTGRWDAEMRQEVPGTLEIARHKSAPRLQENFESSQLECACRGTGHGALLMFVPTRPASAPPGPDDHSFPGLDARMLDSRA